MLGLCAEVAFLPWSPHHSGMFRGLGTSTIWLAAAILWLPAVLLGGRRVYQVLRADLDAPARYGKALLLTLVVLVPCLLATTWLTVWAVWEWVLISPVGYGSTLGKEPSVCGSFEE